MDTLDPLEDRGDALTHADAHRGQAKGGVAVVHGVDERGGDASSGSAQRMADGDCSAADVDLGFVQLEHADSSQGLRREGFIELDEVDVGEMQTSSLEGFLRGGDGASTHH